jgi:hypothetical protein
MLAGRYAHAKQFNRQRRQLRLLRTRLGRIIRDIRRKIGGKADLEAVFEWPLTRANQIRSQQQRQRGWKLYSFHAPEAECIGKGKASAPYEFGVKASIVTTNARAPGGQFVLHAKALPGNPYDGHTLGAVIEATEGLTGCEIERAYVDKGYRARDTTIRAASSSLARSAARTAAYGSHPSSHVWQIPSGMLERALVHEPRRCAAKTSQRDRQQSPDRIDRSVRGTRLALTESAAKKPSSLVQGWGAVHSGPDSSSPWISSRGQRHRSAAYTLFTGN